MEDDAGIPHRRPDSKPYGKYSTPIGSKPNAYNMRKFTRSPENIAVGKQKFKPMRRDPYDPMTYSDVFGGPPRCIYSRYRVDEPCVPMSYDEVFRPYERELNLSTGSSLPVFELPLYGNSSLPVLELPVFGGSELPVYEVPSCGEDLGSMVNRPRASGDDFYGDIFRGVDGVSSSFCEESATKSSVSRPSRSRSKSSSSSQPSSEKPSPHRPSFSLMAEDHSLSAFTSKLRPIALSPKQDRSLIFGLPCRRGVGYPSRDSNDVSVISSTCSSPSQTNFREPPGVAYSHFNMPRAFNNGMGGLEMDDVFGGLPRQRDFTFLQSSQKTEEPASEVKIGTTLKSLDTSEIYEKKYPVLLNTMRKSSTKCGYDVGVHCNALAPREQMHVVTQHPLSPSQSPCAPQKMKIWKDWMPELNNSYVNQRRGLHSSSSQGTSYVSPTTAGSNGTQEKPQRSRLETLGENSLDDGEGSDVFESYVIEIVSERKEKFTFHDENDNYADDNPIPDASDIAMKEAIAWAKEKFQSGRWEEGQEEVTEGSQGPKDKDAQSLMHKITEADGNTESIIQGDNGTITSREGRIENPSIEGIPQGTVDSSENIGRGLINEFKHRSHLHHQFSICMQETEEHTQEIKYYPFEGQCTPISTHQRLTTEAPNDVITFYNQNAMHQDGVDPLFHSHTPEIQGASAIDTTLDIVTMIDLCNLWEEQACYKLTVPSSDVQSKTLKEIPERRPQSEVGHQWDHQHAVCDEMRLFMHNGNQRVFS